MIEDYLRKRHQGSRRTSSSAICVITNEELTIEIDNDAVTTFSNNIKSGRFSQWGHI